MGSNYVSPARFEDRQRPFHCSYECHEARLPVFKCVYHCHHEVELIAIHNSHGLAILDGHAQRFRAGDVFWVASLAAHSFTNRLKDSKGSDWTQYTVALIPSGFLGKNSAFLPEATNLRRLLSCSSSAVLEGRLRHSIAGKMKQLPQTSGMGGLVLLLDILNEIAESPAEMRMIEGGVEGVSLKQHVTERLAKVHRFIHDHCGEEIDLAAVAKCACMSPSAFSRWFHQKSGKKFKDYLNEVRVIEAGSRLVFSDEPITSLCFDCGFSNLSNFNRQFLRIKGCTPSEFRRRASEAPAQPFADAPVVDFENAAFRKTTYH
jgi:AraC-like DNA-binding protein